MIVIGHQAIAMHHQIEARLRFGKGVDPLFLQHEYRSLGWQ